MIINVELMYVCVRLLLTIIIYARLLFVFVVGEPLLVPTQRNVLKSY